MQESQELIYRQFDRIMPILTGEFFISSFFPRHCEPLNHMRFFIALSGRKHMRYSDGKIVRHLMLSPGQVMLAPAFAQVVEEWNSKHEMISVVFAEKYIRVLYINHDSNSPKPAGPDIFYHIPISFCSVATTIFHSILQNKNVNPKVTKLLFQAFCEVMSDAFEQEYSRSKDETEWLRTQEIMESLVTKNLSREDVAIAVGVHEAKLSRMLKKYAGQSFREYWNEKRLDYAENLLTETQLCVNEIADICGFAYPSYFIRLFHAKYGCTPEQYRNK